MRRFGLEWYGRRSFFDQRGTTGQTLWMDLALARQSGQELHNDYVITDGVEFGYLRRFFRAAVRALVRAFIEYPLPGSRGRLSPMACSPIKPQTIDKTTDTEHDASVDRLEGIPVMSLPPPLIFTTSTPVAPASTDLLLHIEPLPMEQLILHDVTTVCSWPHAARGELFAVARRDIAVARRNLAQLTHYVDLQDEHLAACDGALDDGLPLMSVEMCSRPTGGVRSVLDVAGRSK